MTMTPELRLLLVFLVLSVLVVALRRRFWAPGSSKRHWFETRVQPKVHRVIIGFFGVTLVVWLAIWATAPKDRKDDLGEQMQKLFTRPADNQQIEGPRPPDAQ